MATTTTKTRKSKNANAKTLRYGYHGDAIRAPLPAAPPVTAQDRAKARLIVCGNAKNAAEAKQFLDMLGLLDESAWE